MASEENDNIQDEKPADIPDMSPLYHLDSGKPKADIEKYDAILCIGKKKYEGYVKIDLSFVTQHLLLLGGYFKDAPQEYKNQEVLENSGQVHLILNGEKIENANIAHTLYTDDNGLQIYWALKEERIETKGEKTTKMVRVKFHLFYFNDFIGEKRYIEQDEIIEYIKLEFNEWVTHLASTKVTRNNTSSFGDEIGNGLTHVGELSKSNKKAFSIKDAGKVFSGFIDFFSFMHGKFTTVGFMQGYDEAGNVVFERFGVQSPRGEALERNWFYNQKPDCFKKIFHDFMNLLEEKKWEEAVSEIVYWYYLSNSYRSAETAIILTQAALELLAYQYTIVDRKLISEEGFSGNSFNASDKIRLLFSSLGIPLEIPEEARKLKAFIEDESEYEGKDKKKQRKWRNVPEALTQVRNSIVHAKNTRQNYEEIIVEVSRLGIWYLELTILAICGYNGEYYNRLSGQPNNTPWPSQDKELIELTKKHDGKVEKIKEKAMKTIKEKDEKIAVLEAEISSAKKSPTKKSASKKSKPRKP